MSLQLHVDGTAVPIELRRFPAGETFLKLGDVTSGYLKPFVQITLAFEGNDDLFNLALLVDSVRRKLGRDVGTIELLMPYMPYARQDRVCAPGESLSVKVVADFINGLMLDRVTCWNPHSDVGPALFDNFEQRDTVDVFRHMAGMVDKEQTVLVSPDAGANKKVLAIAKAYGFPHVVRADKTRDVLTGKITGTVVYSEFVGSADFLIVDDILDGGATFIGLAQELQKLTLGEVNLYVTHGIFSSGVDKFKGLLNKIYVSNDMRKDMGNDSFGIVVRV